MKKQYNLYYESTNPYDSNTKELLTQLSEDELIEKFEELVSNNPLVDAERAAEINAVLNEEFIEEHGLDKMILGFAFWMHRCGLKVYVNEFKEKVNSPK